MSSRILVADVPALDACVAQALAGHRLLFVRTLDEATRALAREDFHLLIMSVRFDDSRMFDLLRHARGAARIRHLPVLCVREAQTGSPALSGKPLEVACRALEAEAFVDLSRFRDEVARAAAVRAAAEALIARRGG